MAHISSLHFVDPLRTGENAAFDFSMLLLFRAALIPTFLYWQAFAERTTPWFSSRRHITTRTAVDRRLALGSALFDAGWALGGFCPGPSVAGLVTGHPNHVAFNQERSLVWIFLGGVFVGLGTDWADGCTSGHGISGLARLGVRSLVAVPTFMGGVFVFPPIFNLLL